MVQIRPGGVRIEIEEETQRLEAALLVAVSLSLVYN